MFSVVIPLYNKEINIGNTIQSVLNQTFQDFEIVIVNDGSTDKSLQVVEQIDDSRIRIINKPNGGVSSARNRGIEEAKREWIAFLDGDDLWDKEKLMAVSRVIHDNYDVKWIINAFQTVAGQRKFTQMYHKNGILDNVVDDLVSGLKIQTSAVVVQKGVFMNDSRLFFREGINNSEDREVWYKLSLLFTRPLYINRILSYYIIDDSGTSLTGMQSIDPKHFHFLEMQKRLQEVYSSSNAENVKKMSSYINKFNLNAILGYWTRLPQLPEIFKEHIKPNQFKLLKATASFPSIIKKTILKVFLS